MRRAGFLKRLVSTVLTAVMVLSLSSAPAMAAGDLAGHWAKDTIEAWVNEGLINGYSDGTMRPDANISRAEFIVLVNRSLNLTKTDNVSFTDVQSTDWYYNDLMIAVGNGYISGYEDGRFAPRDYVTRAQAAVMLQKAKGLEVTGAGISFTDKGSIPAWAKDAVGAVVSSGYFTGYPDGSFGADQMLTRATAVVILDRARKDIATKPAVATDVTVDKAGTVIQGQTIEGNLIISDKVGSGSVTVENCIIKGGILVNGGGSNSIHLKDCAVSGNVQMNYNNVRLVLEGKTELEAVLFQKSGELDADKFSGTVQTVALDKGIDRAATIQVNAPVQTVNITATATLKLGADVQTVNVDKEATGAKLDIASGVKVATVQADAQVDITGKGKIGTLEANASGIKTEIKADKTQTATDVTKPTVTVPSGGGSSGGSSGGGSTGGGSDGGGSGVMPSLQIMDFSLLTFGSFKVKIDYTGAGVNFAVKDTGSNQNLSIVNSRLEEDGYYYVYVGGSAAGTNQGIDKAGSYVLTVSCAGYTSATHSFKGSDMMDYFNVRNTDVRSVKTETGRNQLVIQLANPTLEGISFTVMEDGINILKTATYGVDADAPEANTIYTLDLNKEITGGKTYTITLEKDKFYPSSIEYVPVTSITIKDRDATTWELACGDNIYDSLWVYYEVSPANATIKDVTCIVEDETIAHWAKETDIGDGFAISNEPSTLGGSTQEGSTKVRVVSADGGLSDEITVTAKKMLVTDINSTGPTLKIATLGGKTTFIAQTVGQAANKNIDWTTADESIAKVSDVTLTDGWWYANIEGVAPGKTAITATAADGSGVSKEFTVIVYEAALVFEDTNISDNTITTSTGKQKIWLEITPDLIGSGKDVTFDTYTWSTATPDLITLDKSTNACSITPTGTAGTARLTFKGRTSVPYTDVEVELVITITE